MNEDGTGAYPGGAAPDMEALLSALQGQGLLPPNQDPYAQVPSWNTDASPYGDPYQQFPPPEPIDLPDELTPEFIAAARWYVANWCRESRAYAKRRQPVWEKAFKLWQGKLTIRDLSIPQDDPIDDYALTHPVADLGQQQDSSLSEFVYPISPAIMTLASNAFNTIFSGPDPIVVTSDDGPESPTDGFSIAQKVQKLFLRKLEDGGLYHNVFIALLMWPVFGHAVGKTYWSTTSYVTKQMDPTTGQVTDKEHVIRSCPIIQPIPIDRVLIDWQATTPDILSHRGVGHRVLRSYDEIMNTFDAGGYFLGAEEMTKRWGARGSANVGQYDDLTADPYKYVVEDPVSNYLEVWEWHGRIPFQGRMIESCCTFVTEQGAEDPNSGVMVRLTMRPALQCGLRPLVNSAFIPMLGQTYGMSLWESVKDIHYQLSQAIGQFQDGIRFSVQNVNLIRKGGSVAAYLDEHKTLPPGSNIECDDPSGEVVGFPRGDFPAQALAQEISQLKEEYQRVALSTDTFQGISQSRQTATGMSILQQQSAQPASTLATLFVRNYLQPAIDLALAQMQTNILEDQHITVRGNDGNPVSITVTAEEIQSGRFRAQVTLTNQDQMATAKAQVLQNILQNSPQLMPIFQAGGWNYDPGRLFLHLLNLQRIDGSEDVMRRLTPEEIQIQQMQQMQAMQGAEAGGGQPMAQGQQGANGGPMGPIPTDLNQLTQMLQLQSAAGAPNTNSPY